jgi:spermidine synthase
MARPRLKPNGILAQWWPLPTQNDEDSQSLVRSFLDAFPYASLWTTELHEMLLIGSMQPIELDVRRVGERFDRPEVSAALREVGVSSVEALLGTWVTDRNGLDKYAGNAPPVTDDQPRIEYAAWVRRGEFERVLPRIRAFRTDPPLVGADERFKAEVVTERDGLWAFYDAALQAYKGDREGARRRLQRVPTDVGGNPYYRWVVGSEPN